MTNTPIKPKSPEAKAGTEVKEESRTTGRQMQWRSWRRRMHRKTTWRRWG